MLSTLAYFNYEVVPQFDTGSTDGALLHDVLMMSDWKALTAGCWMEDSKETRAFLHVLSASRRFRDVRVAFYVNEHSHAVEKQFSAVTFLIPSEHELMVYLAFRGTDGSFAGWKEDFNMCFKEVIPSQQSAVAYVSGVASAYHSTLMLGGHSKGGNLAEYAALVTDQVVYERIAAVYNHDGPSFLSDPSPRISTPHFTKLLHKTVPESSAYGMIWQRRGDYRFVCSSAMSVFQHEPFTWLVRNSAFVYQDELNPSAAFFDETLDTWLQTKTTDERERFIDTIYELFVSTEANNWSEFQTKIFVNTKQIVGSGSRLDAETKSFIWQTIVSLGSIVTRETIKRFKPTSPVGWVRRTSKYTEKKGSES